MPSNSLHREEISKHCLQIFNINFNVSKNVVARCGVVAKKTHPTQHDQRPFSYVTVVVASKYDNFKQTSVERYYLLF